MDVAKVRVQAKAKGSVLILDDAPELGKALASQLEKEGYMTLWCAWSRDALKALHNRPIDVALVDCYLEGDDINGVEFVRQARRIRGCSYVGISSFAGSTEARKMELVADDFVTRPTEISEIVAVVEEATQAARSRWQREMKLQASKGEELASEKPESLDREPLSDQSYDDPNWAEFLRLLEELTQEYQGEYAAFAEGKLVGVDSDEDRLRMMVRSQVKAKTVMIQRIEKEVTLIRLRRPRYVIERSR